MLTVVFLTFMAVTKLGEMQVVHKKCKIIVYVCLNNWVSYILAFAAVKH